MNDQCDSNNLKIKIVVVQNPNDEITEKILEPNINKYKKILGDKQRETFLKRLMWRMIGPYFCYQY